MSDVIERLKEGLGEVQKRHAEVAKRWQQVQAEWAGVTAELQGYQKVIELETRRELERAAATPPPVTVQTQEEAERVPEGDANKTQLVRDTLAQHPGLTPAQLWGAVKSQITRRNYVYSILKRLKDRKQVVEKRGKYYLPEAPKVVEGTEQPTTLQ